MTVRVINGRTLELVEELENAEAKPCPFCGGGVHIVHEPGTLPIGPPRPTWAVTCRSCAAQGPWTKVHARSALRLWNERWPREAIAS